MASKIKNLTGQRFGRLLILECIGTKRSSNGSNALWKCQCDCGNYINVDAHSLKRGNTRSCGCLHREVSSLLGKQKTIDLTGRTFGRLKVINDSGERSGGRVLWNCICDCGKNALVKSKYLLNGDTKSCGCLIVDTTRERSIGEKNPMFGRTGDKNPNWNPNLTQEDREDSRCYQEYVDWRKLVFERDNYTCAKCDHRGGWIEAHHLYNYSSHRDLRVIISNGVTLCEDCHDKFHDIFSYFNNNVNQFIDFLLFGDIRNDIQT